MYPTEFLLELDKDKTRTTYARITALNREELPIETIEGRVTQGSINLDGASAVRRTCSLTIVSNSYDYQQYLWTFKTKFRLEIGLKNNIDTAFPDIIWFNQGIFLISSFNASRSTNSFTISIQGKDKMCQFNGEMGGMLTSSVDFGTIEEVDKNNVVRIIKQPIVDIIRNAVHMYAGEPLQNIIINDLDDYGLELLEYRYDTPMYLYREVDSSVYNNITLKGDTPCSVEINGQSTETTLDGAYAADPTLFETLVEDFTGTAVEHIFTIDEGKYYIARIEFGQTAGYRRTDLTYAGDLIGKVGETITSILDKIKNMLGEFEYFYDTDGMFVFQRKRSFVNTLWTPIKEDGQGEQYVEGLKYATPYAYKFINGELVASFNNNPDISNVKNDYSVWGERTSVAGGKIPIHLRYSIDVKPTYYKPIMVEEDNIDLQQYKEKYGIKVNGQDNTDIEYTDGEYDWRELIYQMAKDHFKYAHILNDFETRIRAANPDMVSGQTGYEQYYTDILDFWRDLYCPAVGQLIKLNNKIETIYQALQKSDPTYDSTDLTRARQEKIDLLKAEPKVENLEDYYTEGENKYWNKNVYEHPEVLNFWFDFLDTYGELQQYSVRSIGIRPKAINDNNVKSIYFRETPGVMFVEDITSDNNEKSAYKVIQVAGIEQMFSISSQGKSAKDKLDELIYQHGYCCETASINVMPIYYLEPNTRIYIYDEETNLKGDYIVSKLTIPLSYNGTMSLTATKAVETWLY